ncbi:MAG TPA: hypothetical protein PL110_10715, partial [Candidatus Eremiobacteraeota bacterium]|nr:hypothetical protein [Candidatus Eremiobacteraeota bacterium]
MSELVNNSDKDFGGEFSTEALLKGSVTSESVLKKAKAFLDDGNLEEAKNLYKNVIDFLTINKDFESAIDILLDVASRYKALNDKDNAVEFYRRILRIEDTHHEALKEFAYMNFELQRYDTATIMALRQLTKLEPENIDVIEKIAFVSEKTGSTRAAAGNYLKAAELAREQGFYEKAEEILKKILERKPSHKEAQHKLELIKKLMEEEVGEEVEEEVEEEVVEEVEEEVGEEVGEEVEEEVVEEVEEEVR